jgi:serine/threonine-protein kinase
VSQTTIAGRYLLAAQVDHTADGATIHQATDRVLVRPVAITVLPDEQASLVEGAGTVQHRNLLPVHGFGTHKGTTYLVTEPYGGRDLFDTAGMIRIADPSFVRSIVRQLAAALDALAGRGLVHLGLEPLAVRLDPSIHPADPGTVRLGRLHALRPAGSRGVMPLTEPSYIAPEIEAALQTGHVGAAVAEPSADRWALAALAFTLLTGQAPFPISDTMSPSEIAKVRAAKAAGEMPLVAGVRPGDRRPVPAAVDVVLRDAMSPDPARRPASATAFAEAFSRACEDVPRVAVPVEVGRPSGNRTKVLLGVGALVLVLVASLAAWRIQRDGGEDETATGLPASYGFVQAPLADGCGRVEPAGAADGDAEDLLRCSSAGVADHVELVRYASVEDRDRAVDRLLDERIDVLVTCSSPPLAPAPDLPNALACFQVPGGGAELMWSVRGRPVLATASSVDAGPAALEVWLRQVVPGLIEEG